MHGINLLLGKQWIAIGTLLGCWPLLCGASLYSQIPSPWLPAVDQNLSSIDSNPVHQSSEPTGLSDLKELQGQIRKILPAVMPCVVSIQGGSGVIVTSDGVILTASHVAEKAGQIVEVLFSDGQIVLATTLGTNYNSDTGMLKLNSPGPWQHCPLATSTSELIEVKPGDWCLALGYPLSFPRGKPAAVRVGRVWEIGKNQIVTDCPIMGGDSGGPLVNLDGHLIGINSRVTNNILNNVHVPIQNYLDGWKQLAASIDVRKRTSPTGHRAYLGIQGETDFDRVRIRNVHRGSPAESAGLLPEDVLLELDGTAIGTFDDVLEFLEERNPGERVVAQLNRYGQLLKIPIELGSHY